MKNTLKTNKALSVLRREITKKTYSVTALRKKIQILEEDIKDLQNFEQIFLKENQPLILINGDDMLSEYLQSNQRNNVI